MERLTDRQINIESDKDRRKEEGMKRDKQRNRYKKRQRGTQSKGASVQHKSDNSFL